MAKKVRKLSVAKKPKKEKLVNTASKATGVKRVTRKALGDPQEIMLRRMRSMVKKINKLEDVQLGLKDSDFAKKTEQFKKQVQEAPDPKKELDKLLPEAFALVREASKRYLKMRHFDVQLIGAMVLNEGNVAELKTGEGKTLMSTLAAYLNALTGKGVHVVSVNDYLVQRDAGWMGGLYQFLGLSVGVIIPDESYVYDPDFKNEEHFDERFHHLKPSTRKEAYNADITYGTNNEFGFDYLRDNMVEDTEQLRQRDLHFAIVDEVDSILIDEARTPLIISAPAAESSAGYKMFSEIITHLEPEDYVLEEKRKAVNLTDKGIAKIESILGIESLYDPKNVHHIYHLEQALRAQTLFKLDKDYVVANDGEVVIVDSFTGRLLPGRRYNAGLHQAIEAKEGVKVQEESVTLATISFQNYFRLYEKLSGMTGTAKTEEEEFNQVYDMSVVEVPTNKPLVRKDLNDRIYATEGAKLQAIALKIKELHKIGQPVLVGTVSIEKNEMISHLLSKESVPHSVLNAKNNEGEASVVAKAGQKGAVTIATNIAGRGTDIVLGEGVKELGGLFVLGSERHESRRIDNQLRGRAGRQGDPGRTQFYISAEDELMRVFGGEALANLMVRFGGEDGEAIERRSISRAIERSQKLVEGMGYDSRKNVVQYDDVMNRHRRAVYGNRKAMLKAEDHERIQNLVDEAIQGAAQDSAKGLVSLAIAKKKDDLRQFLDNTDEQFRLRGKEYSELEEILNLNHQTRSKKKIEKSTSLESTNSKNKFLSKKAVRDAFTKLAKSTKKATSKTGAMIDPRTVPKRTKAVLKNRRANQALAKKRKAVTKKITKILAESFQAAHQKHTQSLDENISFGFQRFSYLKILDELWMQHLENMDHLREGIGWRSVGQKDPLVEYRFEGQRIFEQMLINLRRELTHQLATSTPKTIVNQKLETELTKAAGQAIDNADQIISSQKEFDAGDFSGSVSNFEGQSDSGSTVRIVTEQDSSVADKKPVPASDKPAGPKNISHIKKRPTKKSKNKKRKKR